MVAKLVRQSVLLHPHHHSELSSIALESSPYAAAGKGQGHLSHAHAFGSGSPLPLSPGPLLMFCPGQEWWPTLQHAAAIEEQGQLSDSHDPEISTATCYGQQGTGDREKKASVPHLWQMRGSAVLPSNGSGSTLPSVAVNEGQSQLCTALGHQYRPRCQIRDILLVFGNNISHGHMLSAAWP